SPIAKPWVTGDKSFAFASPHEVCVSGAFERTGEIFPAGLLDRSDMGMTRVDGFDVGDRVSFSREHQHRPVFGKRKLEHARRGQIFTDIQAASEFFGVQKISIPSRVVRVEAVRVRNNGRNSVVRLKGYPFLALFRTEFERAILMMS